MTRAELRATLVVVVLVVVGVIALWPRGDGADPAGPAASSAAASPTTASPTTAPSTTSAPADLGAARASAALAPCPAPTAPAPVVPALAGLQLECLGAPGRVDLGASLAGRTTLVNLWASWCGPCREELPALRTYAAEPGAVDVLGVDVADTPTAALALLEGLAVRYPSVVDPEQAVGRRVGAPPILPVSVVVRPDGSVVDVPPQILRTPDQVRAAVATALADGGTAR